MDFETIREEERRVGPVKFDYTSYRDDSPSLKIGDEYFQNKYTLQLRVAINFWSNNAQLPRKEEQAKKTLQTYLFKDMLPILHEIKLETTQDEVIKLCSKLEDLMMEA